MVTMSGCQQHEKYSKEKNKVEQDLNKELSIYPTRDLMDFYDKNGVKNENFKKGDKGVWVLDSSMAISKSKKSPLVAEGMKLRINRNTRTAKGYYYVRKAYEDTSKYNEKKYPITYDASGFHPQTEINNLEIENKIKNFKFFVQFGKFNKLSSYQNIKRTYNPEVPLYDMNYKLNSNDNNVKEIRDIYRVPTNKIPTLNLSGQGDVDGGDNLFSYNKVTFQFTLNPPVYYSDVIDFQPQTAEDL